MSETLQRYAWDGHALSLGTAFELHKHKGSRLRNGLCKPDESHRLERCSTPGDLSGFQIDVDLSDVVQP